MIVQTMNMREVCSCQKIKLVLETSLELGSPDPGPKIRGNLQLELILMNPGKIQATSEDFLA